MSSTPDASNDAATGNDSRPAAFSEPGVADEPAAAIALLPELGASPTPTRPQCASCAAIPDAPYYFRGAQVTCGPCKEKLEKKLASAGGPRVFLRAALHGGIAAALGSLLYFAVLKLTGYELGLIAILVGIMVGTTVRTASEERGGWKYQALAIALTYGAIVTSYMPALYETFRDAARAQPVDDAQAPSEDARGPSDPAPTPPRAAPAAVSASTDGLMAIPKFALALLLLFVVALISPFLAGFENLMGWIIIAFALYEAWKINRREDIVFEGPVSLEGPPPAPHAGATAATDA